MKIGIINHGMGNILSIINAIEYLGYECGLINEPSDFNKFSKLILPGVGAFKDCMNNLRNKGFIEILNNEVIKNKKKILGICLGMQVMAKNSTEGGFFHGLGWFDAEVIRIKPTLQQLKIPQIGWNNIEFNPNNFLFKTVPINSSFYFVHSYYMHCFNSIDVIATCNYGGKITAVVQSKNIVATQFHPEKSQEVGLKVLENFVSWNY